MTDHTYTKKIGGNSIYFYGPPSRAGNRYDSHNFFAPRTPQQNGIIERKNRTLKEMARPMLCENNLPKYFWGEAINTACYVIYKVSIRSLLSKTLHELYKGRKPNVSHLRSFGCKCFILNNGKHPISKMDAKSDETIFMGYKLNSKVYRVFNKTSLMACLVGMNPNSFPLLF